MRIYYFSWLRQIIGKDVEDVELPTTITNAAEVMDYISSLSKDHEKAFLAREHIQMAIDKHYAKPEQSIKDASEIAFFPPVTGG